MVNIQNMMDSAGQYSTIHHITTLRLYLRGH